MTRFVPLVLAALALALALGTHARRPRTPTVAAAGTIALQPLSGASGLSAPLGIVSAGDSRLFIIEKGGRIKIYNGSSILPTPFLDVSSLLPASPGNEEGLLGLAFHPNYPATPYFFIHYTNASGDVVIRRYAVSANPDIANAASGVPLLTIPHPTNQNHNGGQLAFGPDGYLYAAIGDGGGEGDPANNAQNVNTLLGKILRIDVDQSVNTAPYHGIPPTNPFAGATPGRDEIWAYGLRNPWRFSFDRATGDLFIADVGQISVEEIDYQPAGGAGGVNYGWHIMEGSSCYLNEGVGCGHASLTPPVAEYSHTNGHCSVTGGYRYRGSLIPSIAGSYVFGDFCSGTIWTATPGSPSWPMSEQLVAPFLISSFGEDSAGELYVADYFGGAIHRIVSAADTDMDGVADPSDNCPTVANPGQENADRNYIDQTPPSTQDDRSWPNSDAQGDACDTDDDNDGLLDSAEPAGCNGSGALSATNRDTDGDRTLDGPECALGTNPANAGSKPSPAACGSTADTDGDRIQDRVEFCGYNTNPNVADTDGDQDGYPSTGLARDGCEAASINGDRVVNAGDQLLMVFEIIREVSPSLRLVSFDVNKDGVVSSGDQLMLAQIIATAGQCP
ncbi:MAG: PQQ-dependent sugar dehydrogenase [Chloroflexi bacterium]|nr:PQQ-dependent sugar dehydrogenase [Chloroflexota bacterium]